MAITTGKMRTISADERVSPTKEEGSQSGAAMGLASNSSSTSWNKVQFKVSLGKAARSAARA